MNTTTDKALIEAKTRLTNAKADQAEIKLAVMRKEYVPVSDINKQWQEQVGRVKQRLLAIPVRLAGLMAGRELSASEIEDTTHSLVSEALTELADSPTVQEPEISDE